MRDDLDRIVPRLQAEFPDRAAIVLVGGFGRGEGSVLRTAGGFRPLNDYDLVVVGSTRSGVDLRRLRAELANDVQVDWVDIKLISKSDFRKLRPTMFNYDLKYGGTVLDGPADLLASVPEMRADEIPAGEAEILLFTRLWCFLGLFNGPGLSGKSPLPTGGDEALMRDVQLAKAALACAESELLLSGSYTVSYLEREATFRQQDPDSELADLVGWATRFKIQPSIDSADRAVEQPEAWRSLRVHFLHAFRRLAAFMYGSSDPDWLDYGSLYMRDPGRRARLVWHSLRGNHRFRNRLHANLAQLYTLAAWDLEHPDAELMGEAARLLRLTGAEIALNSSWDETRQLSAQQRMHV